MSDKCCPILTIARATWEEPGLAVCEEDGCAWYDPEFKCCAAAPPINDTVLPAVAYEGAGVDEES